MDMDDATINNWIETINTAEEKNNTIKAQEFEMFLPIYREDKIKALNYVEVQRLTELFRRRFNLFKNIIVTDSLGKILFELPPALISPKLWNSTSKGNQSLGAQYMAAVEAKNPLNNPDVPVLNDMMQAIEESKDKEKILDYFQERLRIEKTYPVFELSKDEKEEVSTVEETEEVEPETKVTFNTDEMF